MTQSELHRAVARATGDDRQTIAQRGFSLADEHEPVTEDDLEALMIDWDQLQAERATSVLALQGMASVA